jgi:hypothetical protein
VAFRATLRDGTNGVFTGNGGPTTTIVTSGSAYSSFLGSEINDEGTVGIIANLTAGGQAIVIAKGGALTTFVDTSGPFSHFAEGRLSISNQERAVFGADLAAGGTGIFDGPDPVADKILATGDLLFGSTVMSFPTNYLNPRGLNNAGQIIFRANLADGRIPSADYWGWNPDQHQASRVTVPALVLTGLLDTTVLPATEVQLYNDLGSEKKVLIKVDGASRFMVWEGSTSPTWRGPHATLQDAAVQWITSETYQGATRGTFEVHGDGRIEQGPAKVASVVVNDGSAQRSMVTGLTVTFSTVVHLDPGAFALAGQDGGVIQLEVTQAVVDGRSVHTLTFVGAGIIGGSLADGHYTLTIHGGLVHDGFGQALDGAGTGVAGSDGSDAFFRLFGDSDGDGDVDGLDRDLFRSAFHTTAGAPGYLWYFDFDGDGAVDGRDNGQFNRRFGHH